MKYEYKKNRILPNLEAQVVGDELSRISQAHGGRFTPAHVVEESKPKDAVLHNEFEWRDKAAAEKYRQYQARNLINVVQAIPEIPEGEKSSQKPLPVFVNIVEGPVQNNDRTYQPMADVLADPNKRQAMVQRCLEKLVRVRNEFAALQEYAAIWAQVDSLAQNLNTV